MTHGSLAAAQGHAFSVECCTSVSSVFEMLDTAYQVWIQAFWSLPWPLAALLRSYVKHVGNVTLADPGLLGLPKTWGFPKSCKALQVHSVPIISIEVAFAGYLIGS